MLKMTASTKHQEMLSNSPLQPNQMLIETSTWLLRIMFPTISNWLTNNLWRLNHWTTAESLLACLTPKKPELEISTVPLCERQTLQERKGFRTTLKFWIGLESIGTHADPTRQIIRDWLGSQEQIISYRCKGTLWELSNSIRCRVLQPFHPTLHSM